MAGLIVFMIILMVSIMALKNGLTITVKNINDYKEPIDPNIVPEKAITTGTIEFEQEQIYNKARKAKEK